MFLIIDNTQLEYTISVGGQTAELVFDKSHSFATDI